MDQSNACYKSRVGLLKIPGGLDKSWETRRLQGLEMLGQSLEHHRERNHQKTASQDVLHKKKLRQKKRYGTSAVPLELLHDCQGHLVTDVNDTSVKSKLHEDYTLRLEYQIQELSQQLMVERQKNRQDKLNIARLQQELARHKSERPFKEMLTKELERERQLRLESEQKVLQLTNECGNYKEKVSALENDLKKMTEVAQSLALYKSKFEVLRQESVTSNFDGNTLHSDDGEKTKVLLERLRMLEAEKTSLVMENENQSHMYEKCLDEITGQVLEALMTQRNLREECFKLQHRVSNLQQQNIQLKNVFQHRFSFNPDAVCLSAADEKLKSKAGHVFINDIGMSLNSLNSVFSDQDQMQCLLSQISSPSPEFQDNYFLVESSTIALPAALGSGSVAAGRTKGGGDNDKTDDDDDDGSRRKGFSIATLPDGELVPESIENRRTKEDLAGIVSYETEGSHSRQLQNQFKATTNKLCFSKGFLDTEQNRHDHHRSSKDQHIQQTQDAFNLVVKSKANVVSYDVQRPRNEQVYRGNLPDVSLSSDSDCDFEAACSQNQLTVQLDTGSTVSLNEFLDLAVTDFDYDNACALYEQNGANGENCQALLPRPNENPPLETKQMKDDDFENQNSCPGFAETTENSALILLPDVCPDKFNRNSKSAKLL